MGDGLGGLYEDGGAVSVRGMVAMDAILIVDGIDRKSREKGKFTPGSRNQLFSRFF